MKRYLIDSPDQIPHLLFPSLVCLFAAIAIVVACWIAESRGWFHRAAEVFIPSLPYPAVRYAPETPPAEPSPSVADLTSEVNRFPVGSPEWEG